MHTRNAFIIRKIACIATALSLILMCLAAQPSSAQASSSDLAIKDAQAEVKASQLSLDQAETRLSQITSEFNTLAGEIEKLQAEIDSLSSQVLAAQQAMLDGRAALSSAVTYDYKTDTVSAFLSVLFGSQSFSDLTKNIAYMNQIMSHQSQEIATQKQLRSDLEAIASKLTSQKDEQEAMLGQLEKKQAEAQSIVNQMASNLSISSEKLKKLQDQAQSLKKPEAQAAQEVNPGANTIQRPSMSVPPAAAATPAPSSSSSSSSSSSKPSSAAATSKPSSSTSSSGGGDGWRTGRASAYGGESDPGTPNPGTTATGAVCNDYSMGVAVPMAWPDYRTYFGRTVEIVWNGKTVYATVNDCGGMGNGYFSLDLQPGVWKAFGFSTCADWGAREIKYRFL